MFIMGIDGGGTAARVELRDPEGQLLSRKVFGPFNITGIGRDAFIGRLEEIFSFCGNMQECASLCIGGAGLTQKDTDGLIRSELKSAGFHGALKLCGDCEIALRGAMNGPGCILIAGTGSIVYGKNDKGISMRVGGHGHLIDDRGSGYAVGRDALALTVQTLDGCISLNSLADAVLAHLAAKNTADIVNYVYAEGTGKDGIAALAPVVLEAAAAGEPCSMDILRKNADDLALMSQVLIRKLDLRLPRIALSGGLLSGENLYRRMVVKKLSAFADVISPEHDALYGAVMLAREALYRNCCPASGKRSSGTGGTLR